MNAISIIVYNITTSLTSSCLLPLTILLACFIMLIPPICCVNVNFHRNYNHGDVSIRSSTVIIDLINDFVVVYASILNNFHVHLLQQFLILLAGDVEVNPGPRPPKFPSGECSKACTSYKGAKASILCESCDVWFHSDCVGLTDSALNTLGRSDLPWECHRCGLPNFSSGLFDSTIIDGSDNSTGTSTSSTSSSHPGSPLAQSSPNRGSNNQSFKNLRLLEVNFQSIFSKRAEFWSVLDATKPDVVYGCETWLKPSIANDEIFPPGYDIYRRDRKDGYGGVLLAIHSSLNNHQITIQFDTEIVAAKIINDKQSIVLASLYGSFYNQGTSSVSFVVKNEMFGNSTTCFLLCYE